MLAKLLRRRFSTYTVNTSNSFVDDFRDRQLYDPFKIQISFNEVLEADLQKLKQREEVHSKYRNSVATDAERNANLSQWKKEDEKKGL